ncbi:MAG: DeoR family transcriptional regulator [Pseudomonadota bacterium]
MENLTARQTSILELVEEQGFVATEGLVEAFGVTPQTIRRDINQLCEKNLLQRFHGGAGRPVSTENEPYPERQRTFPGNKKAIGAMVAAQIHDGASLFINIGTTTEAVAEALIGHKNLRIVTNNLNVARILSGNDTFEVCVAGGVVRNRDGGIIGHEATSFISQFRLDFGVIGVSGIDEDGALLDFDARETQTAKAIIANSDRLFLVADHSKFGRKAMIRFAGFEDVDELYTDEPPSEPYRSALAAREVTVHVTEGGGK